MLVLLALPFISIVYGIPLSLSPMTSLAFMLLQLVLAIGVPALIAVRMPRRWRLAALALWCWHHCWSCWRWRGARWQPATRARADLHKLIYGLLLIGSVLASALAIACRVAYAVGAM